MAPLEDIREQIQSAKRLRVSQQFEADAARRQWEEALSKRDATVARINGLWGELRGVQR